MCGAGTENYPTLIIYVLRFTHRFLHEKICLKIVIANHSSEMAFSHMHKAFCPIRRDLSKHTTDFIQQVQVQSVKTSIAKKILTKSIKIPVLCTMAQGSTRFEHLEKSIDDYIIEQQNKNTRAKTTRDVKLLIEFPFHWPKKSRRHGSRRIEQIPLRIYP